MIAETAEQSLSSICGLSSQQARDHFAKFGPNDPAPSRRRSAVTEILAMFVNPLVVILLLAAAVSMISGRLVDSLIIITVVLLGAAINYVQTYRSQRAAERLRQQVSPSATVLRDGVWHEIHRHDVVPKDVIRLTAGDLVPADARLFESRDLYVQQAALTGESLPVQKEANSERASDTSGLVAADMVFLGSSVVSGTATALVLATGPKTVFGDIAERLALRPEETEFERSLRTFGFFILRSVFFLVLFIVLMSVALRRDPFESLLFAVALAVGLTPEFLPMITSVTLARGAIRMADKSVIVKHLASIQNLGSMDVLCSDKTGTLTKGEMALDRAVDPLGASSSSPLLLAYLNSKFETGIRSPLDTAILENQPPSGWDIYAKVDEIPFDFERRRLSIVVDGPPGRLLITKGAPENILKASISYELEEQALPLSAEASANCGATYQRLSTEGFRTIAVAYRNVEARQRYSTSDECDLTFAGFLVFSDPPNPDSPAALVALRQAGVQLKILTGDNELVTRHICGQIGIDGTSVVLGEELDRMNDTALGHIVENTTVFARVSPRQKHRILLALKHRGHVIGYIGDGINDAPSLHAADVGISVANAVDVARDAADMILLRPGLHVLQRGIIEGRRASANVMKYLLMGTSSNFGNMFSMAGASLFLPFLPMLPTQILLNNFLYDLAQVTIPSDHVDRSYIRTPQRWDMRLIRDFMLLIGPISSIYDFLTFYVLLRFFHAGERLFHTGWFVESLATQTLVLFIIRTMENPFRSRPSLALATTVIAVVSVGILLPFTPIAHSLGFEPLPAPYFAFLFLFTATYLVLVESAKRWLFAHRVVGAEPCS